MHSKTSTFAATFSALLLLALPASNTLAGGLKDDPGPPLFSWTGFYVGGHAGIGTGDTSGVPQSLTIPAGPVVIPIPPAIGAFFASDYEMSGALYGGHIGYNFQKNNLVFGIEGSISGTSINGDGPAGLGLIVSEREVDWLASVTGRLGYAMGQSLVYAKGGVAWGKVSSTVRLGGIAVLEGDETHVGWTAGVGFEHAINNNLSFRIEYAHYDLGSETHSLSYNGALGGAPGLFSIESDVDARIDTLTVGVSYKF